MKRILLAICLSLPLLLNSGCAWTHVRIKGGDIHHTSATGSSASLNQGEDAKSGSNLDTASEKTTEFIVPAGSIIHVDSNEGSGSNKMSIALSKDTVVKTVIKDTSKASVGGAQVNVLATTIAKLSSMRWLTWVGVAMFIFGIASMFWPPLKALIASTTCSMGFIAGGILMMVLPVIVVGHEILILAGIGGAVGIYFFAHHYSANATKATIFQNLLGLNNTTTTTTTPKPDK